VSDMDIEVFRLSPPAPAAAIPVSEAPARQRREGTFLAGGAPMWWLSRANALGNAALATGLALWFAHGLRRAQPGSITLNAAVRKQMGLSNDQASRGLQDLRRDGLVIVARGGRGRCAEVQLVTSRANWEQNRNAIEGGTT
jgi:hypothetical protein